MARSFPDVTGSPLTTNTVNTTVTTDWVPSHGQPSLWIWEDTTSIVTTKKYADDRATCLMIKQYFDHTQKYFNTPQNTRVVLLCSALRSDLKARALVEGDATWWVTHNSESAWSDLFSDFFESDPELELAPV